MKKNALQSLVFVVLWLLSHPLAAAAGQELTLLIHPYMTSAEIHKKFSPLAAYLGKETGKKIVVTISKDYQQQIDAVGKDQMGLAYMGPNEYVEMTQKYGKKPLLACQEIAGKPFLYGMIIIRKDSPLTSLAELTGKRIAFVTPESTMGYVVPRLMMQEAGVELKQAAQADFLKNHSNVALAVLNGYYDAGAVKDETFYAYQERGLKILAQSPAVHEHVLVASSSLSDSMVATLRKALLKLNDPAVLTAIHPTLTRLVAVKDDDYDSLRQILRSSTKP